MKIKQPKKARSRTKVDFLFERANILSKSHIIKLTKKLRKSELLRTNLDINLVKNSHFLGQRWDHRSPYHLPTLGNVNWVNFLSKLLFNRSKVSSFSFIFQSFIFSISMSDPLLSLLMVCFEILCSFNVPCFH